MMDELMQEAEPASADFYVIGLCLPSKTQKRLSAAFPHCILYTTLATEGETAALCEVLGKVVIFSYIPCMTPAMWLRASAVFNQDEVKVIGIHPHATKAVHDRALEAEMAGVLNSGSDVEAYHSAAYAVQRGELWYPRSYLSHRVRDALHSTGPSSLSGREQDILRLLAKGATNQSIAEGLCVSRDTVRWHLRSIYSKLGVSSRNAALRLAKNKASVTKESETSSREGTVLV